MTAHKRAKCLRPLRRAVATTCALQASNTNNPLAEDITTVNHIFHVYGDSGRGCDAGPAPLRTCARAVKQSAASAP